jgi:hypothetical protein
MFTNRRKDPLVDSVQKVMQENALRREAEAALNRSLGITSKRALPHEKHAAYDKALAEATTKVLNEGAEQIDEISKGLAARYLKGQKGEYKFDKKGKVKSVVKPHKDGAMVDKEWRRQDFRDAFAKHGPGTDQYNKASHRYETRKKGIHTAIDKLAGTAKVNAKEETEINEVSKKLVGRYINKAHYDGGMADFKHGVAAGTLRAGKKLSKSGQAEVGKNNERSRRREAGIETAVKKLTGTAKVHAKEETLAEVSKKLVARYVNKANRDSDMSSFQHGKLYGKEIATKKKPSADARAQSKAHADKGLRREKGISTAVKKLAGGAKVMAKEENQIDEVSREKLTAYISKAKHSDTEKRQKGVQLAVRKKWADPKYGFKKVAPKVPAGGSWPAAKESIKEDAQRIAEAYLKKKLSEGSWGERAAQNSGAGASIIQPKTPVPAPTQAPPMRPTGVVNSLSPETKDAITPKPAPLTPAQTGAGGLNKYTPQAQTARPASTVTAPAKPNEPAKNVSVNTGTGPTLAPEKTSAGQPAKSNTDDAEKNKVPAFVKTNSASTGTRKPSAQKPAATPKKTTVVKKPSAAGSGGNKGPLSGHPEWARKAFSPDSGG